MEDYRQQRQFLKSTPWELMAKLDTDQKKGVHHPDLEKPVSEDASIHKLPGIQTVAEREISFYQLFHDRRSHRQFREDPLSLEEVSFLLWATQGLKKLSGDGTTSFRTVPSGGSRHPFETYVFAHRIEGLSEGVYRYLPLTHELVYLFSEEGFSGSLTEGCLGQKFVGEAPLTLIWTAIPYRTEWRYAQASHKIIGIDAGHLCQNLYLAVEAIHGGTCGIGAYSQEKMDRLMRVDGEDEFTIYIAPVGKVR